MRMKIISHIPIFAAATILLLAAAQSDSSARSQPPSPAPAADVADTFAAETLNVEFGGGTAMDFVESLRDATRNLSNIVTLGEVARLPVPAMTLKNVDIGAALEILESIPRQQGEIFYDISVEHQGGGGGGRSPIHTVSVLVHQQGKPSEPKEKRMLVLAVSDLLGEELTAADVLTAMETALGMVQAEPAEIKFHEETGLVLARGTIEQLTAIENVAGQLHSREVGSTNADMLQEQMSRRTQELDHARAEAAHWKNEHERVAAERAHSRVESEALQIEISKLRRQNEALERQLSELRSHAAQAGREPAAKEPKTDSP